MTSWAVVEVGAIFAQPDPTWMEDFHKAIIALSNGGGSGES